MVEIDQDVLQKIVQCDPQTLLDVFSCNAEGVEISELSHYENLTKAEQISYNYSTKMVKNVL